MKKQLGCSEAYLKRSSLQRLNEELRFEPSQWLANPYLQSITAYYWPQAKLGGSRNLKLDLGDGDQLIASCLQAGLQASARKAILIHGLAGSEDSSYVVRASHFLLSAGYDVIRLNLRGMGPGIHLAQKAFHANQSEDLIAALKLIDQEFPGSRFCVFGFSLGGNMLIKAAAKWSDFLPPSIDQLVSISAPLDLVHCVNKIQQPRNWVMNAFFVRKLKRYYRERKRIWGDETIERVPRFTHLRAFDEKVTAPLAGFQKVEDYYREASAVNWVSRLKTPCLLICSLDDPVVDGETYTRLDANPDVQLWLTSKGGHVAYFGSPFQAQSRWWLEPKLIHLMRSLDSKSQ